jgi:hypothetical protein
MTCNLNMSARARFVTSASPVAFYHNYGWNERLLPVSYIDHAVRRRVKYRPHFDHSTAA